MTIDVEDLTKRYNGTFTLSIPALHIASGQSVGLVGNNGAGKTTFLRLMLDLLQPDTGVIRIGGQAVAQHMDWKHHTGSFLDDSFLVDFLTADEFLAFTGSVYGMAGDEITDALQPYRSFYTDERLGETTKYLRDLSRGNRQKAGLIAAMFTQPRLLVLDEPFASLDPRSQIQLKHLLQRLNTVHDTTMVISSHDLGHVTDVCERIAVIEDGEIARDESTTAATLEELRRYFARALRPEGAFPSKTAQ